MSLPTIHHHGARINMSFAHQKASSDARVYYRIASEGVDPWCIFPNETEMERLAHKFLECVYSEVARTTDYGNIVTFVIDAHLPQEDRAAFLAAVVMHTVIEDTG